MNRVEEPRINTNEHKLMIFFNVMKNNRNVCENVMPDLIRHPAADALDSGSRLRLGRNDR